MRFSQQSFNNSNYFFHYIYLGTFPVERLVFFSALVTFNYPYIYGLRFPISFRLGFIVHFPFIYLLIVCFLLPINLFPHIFFLAIFFVLIFLFTYSHFFHYSFHLKLFVAFLIILLPLDSSFLLGCNCYCFCFLEH